MQIPLYLRKFYRGFTSKLLFFIQLQLFITLVSLPILIAWGLPISIMSIVGNLIFSPFLTIFLLISSLVFFFEILHIPNGFLIYLLELCVHLWSWFLSWGSSQWLIGFAKPSLWVLSCILGAAFFILHCKKISKAPLRIACFVALLIMVIVFLKWNSSDGLIIHQIPCNNGFVTVIKTRSHLMLIDPGVMARRVSNNWVEYTLVKELIEKFGATKIDTLILTRPTNLTFDYAAQICRLMDVGSLYLVTWSGESDQRLLKKYGWLRYALQLKKGKFLRINDKPLAINVDKEHKLIVTVLPEQITYKKMSFSKVGIRLMQGESNTLFEVQSSL